MYIICNNWITIKSVGRRKNSMYKFDAAEFSGKLDGNNEERNALYNIPVQTQ